MNYIDLIIEKFLVYAPKIALAILLWVIGSFIIGRITRVFKRILGKRDLDVAVQNFLGSLVDLGLKVMLLLAMAQTLGFEVISFTAILAAATFAIGMALQGSLGNFAAGVMILLFKPYRIGDLISAQSYTGVVEDIQIFNTILMTPDNKRIIIPNSSVTSGAIENISGPGLIRVDTTFGISYDADIDTARKVILSVCKSCPQVLKDKAVDIFVSELAGSSVNFAVRPWAKSEHYWDVYFYLHENIKKQMDANGVDIPFETYTVQMAK